MKILLFSFNCCEATLNYWLLRLSIYLISRIDFFFSKQKDTFMNFAFTKRAVPIIFIAGVMLGPWETYVETQLISSQGILFTFPETRKAVNQTGLIGNVAKLSFLWFSFLRKFRTVGMPFLWTISSKKIFPT